MKNNFFRFLALVAVLCLTGFGVLLLASHAADTSSSWGFAAANLDKSCKPCNDFYQFAMGGWMKNNPIPADRPSWGTSAELQEKNQKELRQIVGAPGRYRLQCDHRAVWYPHVGLLAFGHQPSIRPQLAG